MAWSLRILVIFLVNDNISNNILIPCLAAEENLVFSCMRISVCLTIECVHL